MYILITLHSCITILHQLNLILSAGKYWYIPLRSLHPIKQSTPCFLHVQRFVSQYCLQLHLTIFSKLSGAAGRSVFFGSNLFCTRDHPNLLVVEYCQFLSIPAPDSKHAYCGTLQPWMLVAEYILVQMMSLS